MKYAQSFLKKAPGVRSTVTRKIFKNVMWPPTDKEKTIPLPKPHPKGCLQAFKFWAYYPIMAETIIVTEYQEYRISDKRDMMRFHLQDIQVLQRNQIQCEELYEGKGKDWINTVKSIIDNKLFADAEGTVDTRIFQALDS